MKGNKHWEDNFPTLEYLNKACDDNSNERDDFSVGEKVLYTSPPLHIGTVHKGQQAWRTFKNNFQIYLHSKIQFSSIFVL